MDAGNSPPQIFAGFLREKQIRPAIVPVGKTSFWRMVKDGRFPKPVKLGPRTTAWHAEAVAAWVAQQGQAGAD